MVRPRVVTIALLCSVAACAQDAGERDTAIAEQRAKQRLVEAEREQKKKRDQEQMKAELEALSADERAAFERHRRTCAKHAFPIACARTEEKMRLIALDEREDAAQSLGPQAGCKSLYFTCDYGGDEHSPTPEQHYRWCEEHPADWGVDEADRKEIRARAYWQENGCEELVATFAKYEEQIVSAKEQRAAEQAQQQE